MECKNEEVIGDESCESENEMPNRLIKRPWPYAPFRLIVALLCHLPTYRRDRPFVTRRVRLNTDLEDAVMEWAWPPCGFPPRCTDRFIQAERRRC